MSGVPTVTEGVASSVTGSLRTLLIAAVGLMALTLMLVFRARRRLLPLLLALAASALTFGVMSLAGASLTIASIAVIPVLIGLAVDYAIQFQVRFDEARGQRSSGGAEPPEEAGVETARTAATLGAPVIATAGLATAVGFLTLLLSPVPMVRSFGALLVVGIVLAFACTLTVGSALLGRDFRALPGAPGRWWRAGAGAGRGARRRAGDALRRTPRPSPPARVAGVRRAAGRVVAPVKSMFWAPRGGRLPGRFANRVGCC